VANFHIPENANLFIEIIIPTYRREKTLLDNFKRIKPHLSERFGVAYCSNEESKTLYKALSNEEHCRYFSNPKNMGAAHSIKRLFCTSLAEYCLILSDEDYIEGSSVQHLFLELEATKPSLCLLKVAGLEKNQDLYELAPPYFVGKLLYSYVLEPSYISGIILKRSANSANLLSSVFQEVPQNAYPHVLLKNIFLCKNQLSISQIPLVHKGVDAGVGGDSHAHLQSPSRGTVGLQALNPGTYGMAARKKQAKYFLAEHAKITASSALPKLMRASIELKAKSHWAMMISRASAQKSLKIIIEKSFYFVSGVVCRVLSFLIFVWCSVLRAN